MIGFWHGFRAPFGGLALLWRLPRTWPLAAVPAILFVLLELGFASAAWLFLRPWASNLVESAGTLENAARVVLGWAAFAVAAGLGWLVALAVAPVLSSPALERIVAITEQELGVPSREPLGFWAELGCGLRAMLLSLVLLVPVLGGLTVLELVAPVFVIVTTPLKLLLGALGVAWGLFDYPLTVRGIGARQRMRFMRQHWLVVLGFGTAFSLVFWLPCLGLLMLPAGVAAATRLYWAIQRAAG